MKKLFQSRKRVALVFAAAVVTTPLIAAPLSEKPNLLGTVAAAGDGGFLFVTFKDERIPHGVLLFTQSNQK